MKFVVICHHDKLLEQLTSMLAASIPALSIERDVVREASLSHWFARMEAAPRSRLRAVRPNDLMEHDGAPPGVPDFLILDEPEPHHSAFETLERITRSLPQLIALGSGTPVAFPALQRAMCSVLWRAKVAAVRLLSLPIWGTLWRWSIKSACC